MLFVVNSAVITYMYNAALNRPAYQSSVHRNRFGAHYGNDGSRHTDYQTSPYCASTNNTVDPWWAVDLGHPTAVYGVALTSSIYPCRKANITGLDLLDLEVVLLSRKQNTPRLKKLCQIIFYSSSVKYEPISIKIGRSVLE